MKNGIQYGELAKYYDLIYSWKDCGHEARILRDLIRRYKRSSGVSLLDVACGTGKHIQQLRDDFECVGIDSSEQMLAEARRQVKGVEFRCANMVDFDLNRRFDVIICLFSSIGYVGSYPTLAKTLRNFAKHLKEGGVVIIEPWFTKSTWNAGSVHLRTYESEDLRIARVGYSGARGDVSLLDERILVAERNKGVSYFRDRQVMGLFEKERFLELMNRAGLEARYLKRSLAPRRGLYIGVKEG